MIHKKSAAYEASRLLSEIAKKFNIQPSIIGENIETIDIDYVDVTNDPTSIPEGPIRLEEECKSQCNGIELIPSHLTSDHQDIERTQNQQ